eukprot:CAMPEP_0205913478 /NCGR_PEP_ID=MMETSP1325-20131115/6558_1 /ASSEMBLY_ACC=CAM_ASM_000708 /TAXON_ID=236786 /ORGANISM="Florenciella sp., Strain RCC1007" /LENGTH=111 /DNA_ID=CAMNT_0053280341 /DNA_START=245 /DNA_END=581 /DNA_ORIENTATION=-
MRPLAFALNQQQASNDFGVCTPPSLSTFATNEISLLGTVFTVRLVVAHTAHHRPERVSPRARADTAPATSSYAVRRTRDGEPATHPVLLVHIASVEHHIPLVVRAGCAAAV